jgi:cytoskeletal protein CcmA (bactofilin family)
MTTYYSANNKFKYTLTNNTDYTVEQLDYDIILDSFNRWDSLVTVDSRHGSSYQITINITIDTLGVGILGGAYISHINYITTVSHGNVVPYIGNITINSSKMYTLKTTNHDDGKSSLYHVLLHEIGHILGIGTLWWQYDPKALMVGVPITSYDDNGTTKYYYTGTNALREYKSYFAYYNGSYNDSFVGIPIEDNGGAGTAEGHAEEGVSPVSSDNRYINGIFHPGLGTELMTGWLDEAPASAPLSKITLGFLEDMGYTVNYNLADVYIMSWPSTTDANNLEQTFIQGFLDVSGNMINRNGNLSVLDGTMDVSDDVSFNSNLSVGGDISTNGMLYVAGTGKSLINGDLSVNGTISSNSYAPNSIPTNAIIDLGNVTPNFTGDVKFGQKVAINTNVDPVADSKELDVSGSINFTGEIYQDGSLFVSGATDLNGLSDVKVGGANFANGLLIGTTHTDSNLDTANNNVGVGKDALYSIKAGDSNVSVGGMSLYRVTTGSNNTAVGYNAGPYVSVNSNTVSIGTNAGSISTGGNNTFIGAYADVDTGLTDLSNSIALGYNTKITASNQIMLGTASETVVAPGQVDICGNLYAQYDEVNPNIPPGAIIGGVGGGTEFPHITINPIDVSVSVNGIQALNEYLSFTIPHTMTALNYFCTSHNSMFGNFEIGEYSATETDKTYYVRLVPTDPLNDPPYYIFSDTVNGTALNTAATGSGNILTLYKGNTYKFIKTDVGHPFMVGDDNIPNITTGIKLESTGTGAATTSTYREPYPLHINGTANIERNLNVAKKLTVSGPIIQW